MRSHVQDDGGEAVALAILRALLVAVILVTEQLVDGRQLGGSHFFEVLGAAAAYSMLGILMALKPSALPGGRGFARLQPGFDMVFLAGLAYTSGGGYSDVRKAFFVIPLAAAFTERPRSTAKWSLLAVAVYSLQAAIAQGHLSGSINTWLQTTLNQDLYLAWTGGAATLLAIALRKRSACVEELAGSRQRLVTQSIESVERERTRLADALHDSPLQNLAAARHDLRRAERCGDPDSFLRLHEAIDLTIAQLREEIFNLHPHVLDHVGLGAALEKVARRHARDGQLRVTVEVETDAGLVHRQMLFALGRELLGNAAKHARASEIWLTLRRDPDGVTLEVTDDGCGIPDGRIRQALLDGHIGLASVQERVDALSGRLSINTAPGKGTSVRVTLPVASGKPTQQTGAHEREWTLRADQLIGGVISGRARVETPDRVTAHDTLGVSTT